MMRMLAVCLLAVMAALPVRAAVEITEVTSEGGITAWVVSDHTIPIIAIEADFRGGAVLDPEGQAGVVNLMAGLLDEGAGARDATAFAEARDDLAARMSFSAGRDSVWVSAEMLSETRDEVVELLRSALVEPRFDAEAVARVRGQAVASLRSDETDPGRVAGRAFNAQMFGGHPYGRPVEGTPESVAALDVEAIRAAHGAALVRDRLTVAVVGDITAEEVGPMLDRLFGDLPEGGPELPGAAEMALDGGVSVIELDVPQSMVIFGQAGIARDDPDFIPAFVMNHILGGGGFGSRLTEEIRERRGLSYGIYTGLTTGDYAATVIGRFSTVNARAGEAIGIVRDEWARMRAGGATEAELAAAQRYLTGAYPLRFDGYGQIAGQLLALQIEGLGIDYVEVRNDLVEAVTLDDIARVAGRLLDPERLTFVVVGRPEGLHSTD